MEKKLVLAITIAVLGFSGCGEGATVQEPCDPGTREENGLCVADEKLVCGKGTAEKDGECVPVAPMTMDEKDMQCALKYGFQTCYTDKDGDGVGITKISVSLHCKGTCALWGMATRRGDCDDKDANSYPGSYEQCDGKDNDCDGKVDEGCTGSPCTLDSECQDGICSALGYTSDWKPAGACLKMCRSTTKLCPPLSTCAQTWDDDRGDAYDKWSCVPTTLTLLPN